MNTQTNTSAAEAQVDSGAGSEAPEFTKQVGEGDLSPQERVGMVLLQGMGSPTPETHPNYAEHVAGCVKLSEQIAAVKPEDIDSIIVMIKERAANDGKPGFNLIGGMIGTDVELGALHMMITGRLDSGK